MKIAIISDIHDHDIELAKALEMIRESGAEQMIVLGDIVAPTSLEQLVTGFTGQIHLVFGNNDGDIFHLSKSEHEHRNLTIYGYFGEVEIDGVRIAFMHEPRATHAFARSGMYDLVLFGHLHAQHAEIIEKTLIASPGAIRPPLPSLKNEQDSSFALFDTTKPTLIEFVNL